MEVVAIGGYVVGIVGIAYAIRFYLELRKWAKQCQNARIAVAYKRKVALQAPLVEWLLWCRQAEKDKASTGRVVFSRAGVSVAVAQAVYPPGPLRKVIQRAKVKKGAGAPKVQEGKWTAEDRTAKP